VPNMNEHSNIEQKCKQTVQVIIRGGSFFPNLAVEDMPNYEFLLDHSHFAYVEPLSNHTSSTAKLGKKGSTPYCHCVLVSYGSGGVTKLYFEVFPKFNSHK